MDSRREFLKKAGLLAGAGGIAGMLPESISRAFAINPQEGSTFVDAEHVVILMQENRSFDHCFGTLSGVRGFNDPRAFTLPDKKPVWLQTDEKGDVYAPFRLDIKNTNATWMGSLPHGWTDQTDARNGGRFDKWLITKKSGHEEYKEMPLALGYYNREDIPFYYSLADAFTVCDQNFCSSLAGTTPNRLHLWTGTLREDAKSPARVRNEDTIYNAEAEWITFPERLEEQGISWKIYQNEIGVGVGFEGEQDDWLGNFEDNPTEWFSQFKVRFHPAYIKNLPRRIEWLKQQLKEADEKLTKLQPGTDEYKELSWRIEWRKKELAISTDALKVYTEENWNKLPQKTKDLHQKAFVTNINDPDYHQLASVTYDDNGTKRELKVPKGDLLHQFRKDVNDGTLPTVSWLVPPANFSDHPGSPWYGAWYLSEAMDILTKNPEVWKKTIFILCYDENDGYFDHVPPFVPPLPGGNVKGAVSRTIDTSLEEVTLDMDLKRKPAEEARGGPIGLGYRVPLVIASPWSRGGAVNSQVCDHTSILMFLEKWLNQKTGKKIEEKNISPWRRAVCGDLTSVFRPYNGEKIQMPERLKKDDFVETIHKAQFRNVPTMPAPLTASEIAQASAGKLPARMPSQEKGNRKSCALPYEIFVSGKISEDKKNFQFNFEARRDIFKERAAGAPFMVYALGKEWATRSYAVAPGELVEEKWPLESFDKGNYHFRVDGPNGFHREFIGNAGDEIFVDIGNEVDKNKMLTGNLIVNVTSRKAKANIEITDNAYGQPRVSKELKAGGMSAIPLNLTASSRWYDSTLRVAGTSFQFRFAGRVETGQEGITDPVIGRGA